MLSTSDQPEALQTNPTPTSVWIRRLIYLGILLITVVLLGILFWLAGKMIVTLLILLVAAVLAYAVVPVIELLHRIMPRALAIALVYVGAIILLGLFAYLAVKSMVPQVNSLSQSVQTFLKPGITGKELPLDQTLKSFGITQSQINAATKQLQSQLGTIAASVASGTRASRRWSDQCWLQHPDHRGCERLPALQWLPLWPLAERQFTRLSTRLDFIGV